MVKGNINRILQLVDADQFPLALLNQLLGNAGTIALTQLIIICKKVYPEYFPEPSKIPRETVQLDGLSSEQLTILQH